MGFWSRKALAEAKKYGDVKGVATFDGDGPPPWVEWGKAARKDSTCACPAPTLILIHSRRLEEALRQVRMQWAIIPMCRFSDRK